MKNMTFKLKLTLSFMLFYFIPLVSLLIIGYCQLSNVITEQVLTSYKTTAKNLATYFDTEMQSLSDYSTQVSQRYWIHSPLYAKDIQKSRYNYLDFSQFSEEFSSFAASSNIVDEVFLYFSLSDSVLSTLSSGMEPFDWFGENTFCPEIGSKELKARLQAITAPTVMQFDVVNTYGNNRKGFLVVQPLAKDYTEGTLAQICFFLTDKAFDVSIKDFIAGTELQLRIVRDGEIIYSSTDSLLDPAVTMQQGGKTDEMRLDGKPYYLCKERTKNLDWEYQLFVPKENITQNLNRLQILFVLIVALFSVVGYILSYIVAMKNYQPIQQLVNKVALATHCNNNDKNEFSWLDKAIRNVLDEQRNLKTQIESQKPVLRDAYLTWLLDEGFPKDAEVIQESLKLLDINLNKSLFNCIVSSAFAGMQLKKDILAISPKYSIETVCLEKEKEYVFLLNYSYDHELNAFVNELIGLLRLKTVKFYFGLGNTCGSLENFSICRKQAGVARNFRMINDESGIFSYDEVSNQLSCSYYYPVEKEAAIKNCLYIGDYQAALNLVEEVLSYNLISQPVSYERLRNFFYNLQLTGLKCLDELGQRQAVEINFEKITSCQTLDEFKACITTVYQEISMHAQDFTKERTVLSDTICSFINENLTAQEMSLTMVSEHFHISSSYVSKLFKEQMKINFLEYVSQKRINLAQKMMKEHPEYDVMHISKLVGYDSDTTFRRLFKKQVGITPVQYKKAVMDNL